MRTEEEIAEHLCELEVSLLEPGVRKTERVSQLLAEGFVEFGSSGCTFNKAQIIASLRAEQPIAVTAAELKAQLLSPRSALVTYRACRHTEPPVYSLRSSVWQEFEGQWRMVFHQGTIATSSQ